MATKRRSLREVIRSRQQSAFVGRQAQLALFEANLGYDPDDERRRWIFNIHGPAGVGKTFLVKQWTRIAQTSDVAHAYLTDTVYDAPEAMAAIATALSQQDAPLKRFQARYQTYEQRRGELQADPAAPQEAASLWTTTAVRLTLRAAREIPVVKVAAAVADDPAVAEGADRLRRYLLDGERYGDLPDTLTVTIAGQYPLDPNRWAPYHGLLADLPLEPFTELEARELLARHGVTDPRVIEVIVALSGRLPLWVASLAASRPDDPATVGDPSGSAVERFLRWEDDPQRRDVALTVAVARWFNRDLLAAVLDAETAGRLWEWMRTRPFVSDHPAGYQYHQAVRAPMLRLHRRESPDAWHQRHQQLADFHLSCRDALGLQDEAGWADPVWQQHALEETYHRLCAAPHAHLADALDQTLRAYEEQTALARRWIEGLQQAGTDTDAPNVQQWGQRLQATMAGSDDEWVGFLTLLAHDAGLPLDRQVAVWRARGRLHGRAGRYESALADFDRALQLRPDDYRSLADRGVTYRGMERYDEALADLNKAIDLDPSYAWAIASRGQTYRDMKRYDEALADFTRAIDLNPDYTWAIASRGQTYRQMGRYDEALADLNKAIDLDPKDKDDRLQYVLAVTHLQIDDEDRAQAALRRAIHLGTQDLAANGATLPRLCNLALYHLAAGEIGQSERLWAQALTMPGAAAYIRGVALDALRDLRTVLPDTAGLDAALRLLADHITTD